MSYAVNLVNDNTASYLSGNTIPIGDIVTSCGCLVDGCGRTYHIKNKGCYIINVSATLTAAAGGNISLALYNNDRLIRGAEATQTVALDDLVNLSITTMIKITCPCNDADISLRLDEGTANVQNITTTIVKIY